MATANQILADYFRCPGVGVKFDWRGTEDSPEGFFRFGDNLVCYGRSSAMPLAQTAMQPLHDALGDVWIADSRCAMPFDPAAAVNALRWERYVGTTGNDGASAGAGRWVRTAYYGIRPWLPVAIRKYFQKLFLTGRLDAPFPSWPVDRTVDRFLGRLLGLSLKASGREQIPFIWFWPEGHSGAVMLTHDVETSAGVQFCSTLMGIDEEHGFRSSFQLVPEERYSVPESLLREMRRRGFEINIHDLNHDGRLYWEREEFLRRAARINRHAQRMGARGFRSAVLYRNPDWYDALEFAYDMSVPNVAHLDPQRGGCCTVMPYFIGRILELPVTATQDYPLFQILGTYSLDLWIRQIERIREGHGLISFITHPDYLLERRARATYRELLAHLARTGSEGNLWLALPEQVNDWWRARSEMRLVWENGAWRIEGREKERARIAHARLEGNDVRFTLERDTGADPDNEEHVHGIGLQHNA